MGGWVGGILKLSELDSLSKFTLGGGDSEIEKSQSVKIHLNLNYLCVCVGGVFWNFGFVLRKKLEIWIFGMGGGYSGTLDLYLGKSWKFGFLVGGVFWNFGFV